MSTKKDSEGATIVKEKKVKDPNAPKKPRVSAADPERLKKMIAKQPIQVQLGIIDSIKEGLVAHRAKLQEQLNLIPEVA
jgi:hypothetical protein